MSASLYDFSLLFRLAPISAKRSSYPNNAVGDCAGGDTQVCSSIAQDCISHCHCIPVGLIVGICVKFGGPVKTTSQCFSHIDCINRENSTSSSHCIRVAGGSYGFCS
ncbi:hypothetical protein LIER_09925 [Lithospermum erythrorhizon]|uniref:TIL domain-containing protein n=1 Tax=Lithospermum erythrorhizon TaxID=34254 RepID=A0AAV3PJR9_LITER